MAKQIQIRRGTTAQHSTFTGAPGEITVDTDKNTVVVQDGVTAGGFPLAPNSAFDKANAANLLAYNTGIAANAWSNAVGVAANTTANAQIAAANAWANVKTANVFGTAGRVSVNYSTTGGYNNATVDLISSGVTANTYGGATTIPIVTIDAYGRVTSAANVTVTAGASVGKVFFLSNS